MFRKLWVKIVALVMVGLMALSSIAIAISLIINMW